MAKQWRERSQHLPIFQHLTPIAASLNGANTLVLKAPPGTGKTTVLPLGLLDLDWLGNQKILILQPRRLAARSVATRMSELLCEKVGTTVGYQMRLERVTSAATRIEIITEGILTRRIQSDPSLEGVGAIIFDEFHERSVHADIGLALALEVASSLRPDLKIIVMSATLADPSSLPILSGAAYYECTAHTFPVSVSYQPGDARLPLWERMATAISGAMQHHDGDVLAFLPGAYEIQRTESLLVARNSKAVIFPLYGELPPDEQQRALLPDPSGRRKIVLSTPIAETSVTIDGVRIVVDSGYHKVSRSDSPGSTLLKTERISRDSSEQRAGRAGRTAPGVCIRLWSEQEQLALREFREPEVLRVDLSSVVLDLAAWGVKNPADFGWITPPPPAALDAALRLLRRIGAITADNTLSADGRILADLGAHPLLGRLALAARTFGLEHLAARLLALIEERDLLGSNASGADIHSRLALLTPDGGNPRARRALQLTERWERRIMRLPKPDQQAFGGVRIPDEQQAAFLLAQAFPLTIAQRRDADGCRYLMANGRGCALRHNDLLKQSEYIVVVELKEEAGDGRVVLAASLDKKLFDGPLARLCSEESSVAFDPERGQLLSIKRRLCGAIVLSESSGAPASLDAQREALASYLGTTEGFAKIPFSSSAERLRLRAHFARQTLGVIELPDLTDLHLQATIATWLAPFLVAPFKVNALAAEVVDVALQSLLPYQLTQRLSELAPDRITLPSGRERVVEYSWDGRALLQSTIQELFGMRDTPRLGSRKVPVTIHLLSPAKRPMQVTQDLAGFWATGYQAVRKELRGRYPKHPWPEDPTVALPPRGKR